VRVSILFAVGFVLLNVLAYRHAYAMMHFEAGKPWTGMPESLNVVQKLEVLLWGVNIPRPYSDIPVNVLGKEAKSLQIGGDGNVKLGAWYCPGPVNSPLVILFHGYTGEKSGALAQAKVFLQLGCSVLLVDFRGSGDSSETYTTIGYVEADDVAAAVRYAQRNLSPPKVILYGVSMGGAAVLRAVAACGIKPDAIIVEAVFDRLLNTVRHRFEAMKTPSFPSADLLIFWGGMQNGFDGFKLNPVDYARSVKCPILFLHGTADPRAHVEEARRVFDAVPGRKQLNEFPGVEHVSIVTRFPGEWKQTVGDFLKQFIWESATSPSK
jgi:pimeloyl-ACP methyl ester carboxylesterase